MSATIPINSGTTKCIFSCTLPPPFIQQLEQHYLSCTLLKMLTTTIYFLSCTYTPPFILTVGTTKFILLRILPPPVRLTIGTQHYFIMYINPTSYINNWSTNISSSCTLTPPVILTIGTPTLFYYVHYHHQLY